MQLNKLQNLERGDRGQFIGSLQRRFFDDANDEATKNQNI